MGLYKINGIRNHLWKIEVFFKIIQDKNFVYSEPDVLKFLIWSMI